MGILTLPELDILAWYSLPEIAEALPSEGAPAEQLEDDIDQEPPAVSENAE
jgi:hypothetical protein